MSYQERGSFLLEFPLNGTTVPAIPRHPLTYVKAREFQAQETNYLRAGGEEMPPEMCLVCFFCWGIRCLPSPIASRLHAIFWDNDHGRACIRVSMRVVTF